MASTLLLIGRIVFSVFFIYSGYNHLANLGMMAQYTAGQGVPAASLAVVVSAIMLLAGGLTILLGWQVRLGALLLVAFLVPVAIIMHRFWGLPDPMMAQNQAAHFWKNITLAGAALMIYGLATLHPGRWPYSVGARGASGTSPGGWGGTASRV
ncbi:MAG: DoxX family protein [Gemmatimonadales bacterium]